GSRHAFGNGIVSMAPSFSSSETLTKSGAAPASRPRLTDGQFGVLLVLPALVLFAVVILYPLLHSLYMGFLDRSLVFPGEEFVGLRNIERFLRRDFLDVLEPTVVFTLGATVLPFVLGF